MAIEINEENLLSASEMISEGLTKNTLGEDDYLYGGNNTDNDPFLIQRDNLINQIKNVVIEGFDNYITVNFMSVQTPISNIVSSGDIWLNNNPYSLKIFRNVNNQWEEIPGSINKHTVYIYQPKVGSNYLYSYGFNGNYFYLISKSLIKSDANIIKSCSWFGGANGEKTYNIEYISAISSLALVLEAKDTSNNYFECKDNDILKFFIGKVDYDTDENVAIEYQDTPVVIRLKDGNTGQIYEKLLYNYSSEEKESTSKIKDIYSKEILIQIGMSNDISNNLSAIILGGSSSDMSDIYSYNESEQTAEIKWLKNIANGLGFKITGWGFEYKGFKRLVGETFELAADGINYMRYHTSSLLKLFIQNLEILIADSVAVLLKRVSKYTAEEVNVYTGWIEGDLLPSDTYRLIDDSFTTEELAYEISLASTTKTRIRLFDHNLSSDDDRKHYQSGGIYYKKTGNTTYYIENDVVIAGGNDPTNTKSFVEVKQGDKTVLVAGYGKPGGSSFPTPLSADDPHEQYSGVFDGKQRPIITTKNEEDRRIYSKDGSVVAYWSNTTFTFLKDVVMQLASSTKNGLMSIADKIKLDAYPSFPTTPQGYYLGDDGLFHQPSPGIDSTSMSVDGKYLNYGTSQYGGTIVTDCNAITRSGMYSALSTATGVPNSSYDWLLQHINSNIDTNSATQRFIAKSDRLIIYERVKNSGTWQSFIDRTTQIIPLYCSDMKTDIVASSTIPKISFTFEEKIYWTGIIGELRIPFVDGSFIVSSKVTLSGVTTNGFSTNLTFDSGESSTRTASVPVVLTTNPTVFNIGDKIELFVESAGTTTAGQGLLINLITYK